MCSAGVCSFVLNPIRYDKLGGLSRRVTMSSTKKEDMKSFEVFQKELPKLKALGGKYR